MYVDKPMRGHGLMQAIARVNRVFKDKPGGLVVDYLGLADELKQALATYTESGGTGQDGDRSGRGRGGDAGEVRGLPRPVPRLRLVALDHRDAAGPPLAAAGRAGAHPRPGGRQGAAAAGGDRAWRRRSRWRCRTTRRCASATTWGSSRPCARCWRRARPASRRPTRELDHAIRQIISKAVVSDEVVDIFAAAGLKKPDISILSDEFLAEVRGMPQRNLAVELLQKLLKGEIKARARRNVVQARSFAELLEQSVRKYQNRAIETAQVIEGADRAREGHARRQRARRGAQADRGRAGLLRRAGSQRQRREGARRADAASISPASWWRP